MVSFIALFGVTFLLSLAFTRRRVLIICAFYACYGLLTILNADTIPIFGGLTIYRLLYLILLISIGVRILQDDYFLLRARQWPLASFLALLFVMIVSSFYSPSNTVLSFDDPIGLYARIVVVSLLWIAASHIQEERDLLMFATTTVLVSLVLSGWVIWTAWESDFTADRGGILVNENYVAIFILTGAIPLVDSIYVQKNRGLRVLFCALLLCVVLASLILASRGTLAAFAVAAILMAVRLRRSLGHRRMLTVGACVALVLAAAAFLPGGGNFLSRLDSADIGTLNERTNIWSHSLDYFVHTDMSKMVFGQGLSSSASIISPMLPDVENYHNVYLQWLMEQGILGLTALMVFLSTVVRLTLNSNHPLKNIMIGWLSFFLVTSLGNTVSDDHEFWILLGVIIGASISAAKWKNAPRQTTRGFLRTTPLTYSALEGTGGS